MIKPRSHGRAIRCAGLSALVLTLLISLVIPSRGWADELQVQEHVIAATSTSRETMPRLGNDGVSNLMVYIKSAILPDGGLGKGEIWYQRLTDAGAPLGDPVQVPCYDGHDCQYSDVSGDYIVFTAYVDTTSMSGKILVYQISTGIGRGIAGADIMQEVRIHGTKVVWREGGAWSTQVMLYDLQLGMNQDPVVLAGPTPPAYGVEIGDRFVVWSEATSGQLDLVAYDLADGRRVNVTATPSAIDYMASTSGAWITWSAPEKGSAGARILARNMDTGEERVVADNGAYNWEPSIGGDLIAYASTSDLLGNLDVFVYRISTSETFRVTNGGAANHYSSNVFGNLVAYTDALPENINEDIHVARLTFNNPPLANAGPDQTVRPGVRVTLDGSGSSDLDGDLLTYQWAFDSKPSGSAAALSDPAAVSPSFTADLPGTYVIRLVVTDSGGLASAPATVTISTTNTKPIAEAGPDQAIIAIGTTVQLDGTQSWDPDGDPLTYQWIIVSKPGGSGTALSDPTAARPTFVADVKGTYVAQLVVADPWAASDPDTVTISFNNVAPVADAGGNQAVMVGDTVVLNGRGSDANGDPLTFRWSFASVPEGSNAVSLIPR